MSERLRRATIKDVAARAGVGTMTVSRVVTGKGYVSDATREKVERAIAELGYLPNHQARGLRSRTSGTIALIVGDITNPYFTTLAAGAEVGARMHDSLLLIAGTGEDESEEVRCVQRIVKQGVDGVLLVPSHAGTEALEIVRERGVPCVVVDRHAPPGFDCVRCDSASGAAELAQLLLRFGHRNAGILAAGEGVTTSDDRIEGFRRTFEAGGGATRLERGALNVEAGQALTRRLMAESAPTCLFAVNNFLAIGALKQLAAENLRVPRDVSVVGFDDLPSSMLAFPFLTVALQPAHELGSTAAELLFRRIAEPGASAEERLLSISILERESVAPPRPPSE